jgi:hypothetical protein
MTNTIAFWFTISIAGIALGVFIWYIMKQQQIQTQTLEATIAKNKSDEVAAIASAVAAQAAAAQAANSYIGDADYDNNWAGNGNLWRAGYGRGGRGLGEGGGGRGGGGGHGGRR